MQSNHEYLRILKELTDTRWQFNLLSQRVERLATKDPLISEAYCDLKVDWNLYTVALNSVADAAVAEEIVQDIFTRVWEKAYTYDARIANVSTWLARIA